MTNNGLSGVTLTLNAGTTNAVNFPPTTGSYALPPNGTYTGNAQYVEVFVKNRKFDMLGRGDELGRSGNVELQHVAAR